MDDYYQKYAKPINPFTYENVILTLNKWNKNIREELEILIYSGNNIKNDSLNKIIVNDKKKVNEILEKLKFLTIKVMENINDLLIEINNKKTKNFEQKYFTKTELIRDNYNKIVFNNNKFIISNPNLMKLKEEYLKLSRKKLKNFDKKYYNNDLYQDYDDEINNNNLTPFKSLLKSQKQNKPTNQQLQMDYYLNDMERTLTKTQSNNFSKSYNFSENEKDSTLNNTINFTKSSLNKTKTSNNFKSDNKKFKNNLRKRANSTTFKSVNSISSLQSNNQNKIKLTQLQNENSELKDELSFMRNKIDHLTELYNKLSTRIDDIQHENNLLKIHNQKLVNFISENLNK